MLFDALGAAKSANACGNVFKPLQVFMAGKAH
jgi:hypothetical protein